MSIERAQALSDEARESWRRRLWAEEAARATHIITYKRVEETECECGDYLYAEFSSGRHKLCRCGKELLIAGQAEEER